MATEVYIVNELLAYIFHRYNSDTCDDIKVTLNNFYGDEDVSDAKSVLHQHYEEIIGPKPARQNRGAKTLKQKEIDDIMEATKKLDEHGPQRKVKFVALNLTNLPSIPARVQLNNNDDHDIHNRMSVMEKQMAELLASQMKLLGAVQAPQRVMGAPQPPKPRMSHPTSVNDHQQHVNVVTVPTPVHTRPSFAEVASTSTIDDQWVQVRRRNEKRNPTRKVKFGNRDSTDLRFKAVPRRHDFVVFNAPRGCDVDTVKTYITENGVNVLNIKRLSDEEWTSQSFHLTISHDDEPKVCEPEFWPNNIGYRRFYKQNRTSQRNHNGDK